MTPPAFAPAGFTQTPHVTPFVLQSASQFRPPAPPALTSAQYAENFREVHSLGELHSTTRTADETAIGTFWSAAPVWVVWNQIADQAAVGFDNSLEQKARMFAMLDTTLADSAIALYDAKYAYHRWRPITAITTINQGNANTTADPNWLPLSNTANDPSYPGAQAEFSQAAATVLRDFFGTDAFSFSLTNAKVGITRTFSSLSQPQTRRPRAASSPASTSATTKMPDRRLAVRWLPSWLTTRSVHTAIAAVITGTAKQPTMAAETATAQRPLSDRGLPESDSRAGRLGVAPGHGVSEPAIGVVNFGDWLRGLPDTAAHPRLRLCACAEVCPLPRADWWAGCRSHESGFVAVTRSIGSGGSNVAPPA